jgi:hypothetical protein
MFLLIDSTDYVAPHGGRPSVQNFDGRCLCSLDERTTFMPHFSLSQAGG